jgi:hypothetical protein
MLVLSLLFLVRASEAANATFTNSPAAVGVSYNGNLTLQIGNIPAGDTVVVQKYNDLNTNGVIDAGDLLVQQFQVTDGQAGMVIGGVTNFDVPGDLNVATGAITAVLHFNNGDFSQRIAGKYLYKISSPVGHFPPITNLFVVTNFAYGQKISGTVVSNGTSTTLPNSIVLLFPAPRGGNHGPGKPVTGVVADNSGNYTIPVAPGTYVPMAIRSNYVATYATSPVLTVASGVNTVTNLTLTVATASISGSLVDAANNSTVLPGVFLPVSSSTGLIGTTFSDTNGNFTLRVVSGQWGLGSDDAGLIIHGYVGFNNDTQVSAGATGVTIGFSRASALFYGNLSDNYGNPLPGIDLSAMDVNSNIFNMDAYTDTNGNYDLCLVGGLNNDSAWQLQLGNGSNPIASNYVYSTVSAPQQSGGVNMSLGQSLAANITAIYGSNQISGRVLDSSGNPIVTVGVFAYATINGINYFPLSQDTDTNGDYLFAVPNTDWTVSVNCTGGSDSLSGIGSYACPPNQFPGILNNNSTNNFIVQICGGVDILTTNLPAGMAGFYYDQFLQAESCSSTFNWSVLSGNLASSGLNLSSSGELFGSPNAGTYNFTVHVIDGSSYFADQTLSLVIATNNVPPPAVNVSAAAGRQFIVYYPTSGSNYILQTTTNLATGPWVPATNGTPVIAQTFSNTAPAQFYRLVSP